MVGCPLLEMGRLGASRQVTGLYSSTEQVFGVGVHSWLLVTLCSSTEQVVDLGVHSELPVAPGPVAQNWLEVKLRASTGYMQLVVLCVSTEHVAGLVAHC